MIPEYFDIHSHLDFKDYDLDREAVIEELKKNNVWAINVGVNFETSKSAVALAEKHENLFATIGLHPHDDLTESFNEKEYEKLVVHPKVVAIGECGLDYARKPEASEITRQKAEFEKQIEFTLKHNKPLMIHCRDAYPDVLEILKSKQQTYGEKIRGNFHFFTSPIEIAKKCLEIGFTVSFTGPITYGNQYDEVVKYVPLDRMMAETDAPFAAPVPFRGKRNNPLYVREIVKRIAEIKALPLETVQSALVQNARNLFKI